MADLNVLCPFRTPPNTSHLSLARELKRLGINVSRSTVPQVSIQDSEGTPVVVPVVLCGCYSPSVSESARRCSNDAGIHVSSEFPETLDHNTCIHTRARKFDVLSRLRRRTC
ncbi:hypothetical protein E2C01_084535 [Portunus trituberculatus]|uniref:Uncharacterized protein n=1 Tax=Portunus trituberculatus TaxID=210409 RepID=A0A5B7IVK6_PORTR|nr:hypothetical protein [Portunus trituberculatus]